MTQESSGDNTQLLTLLPLINKTVVSATELKEFGYTKSQFIIFSALTRCGDLTMSQVASYISSSKEQATRAVAPLVDDGLVERYIAPENRTRIHIRLTNKGSEFMNQCKNRFHQKIQLLMDDKITPEEKEDLNQAIETLIRILSKFN